MSSDVHDPSAVKPFQKICSVVYWKTGFRNLTNRKRPVNKMEDFDGIKLRVMQNNVFLTSCNMLGANAVPVSFSKLFGALESKTVDGQKNPFNTILSSKFYEVQKYLTVRQLLKIRGSK